MTQIKNPMVKNDQLTRVTNEQRYARSLIEASIDPLVTINAEGKILDVNEASIQVTGLSREEIIGTNFSLHFTDPKKAQAAYLQAFENGFVSDYTLTIKHKNGLLTDVSYNASVYKDNEGNVLGVFAAARDVTNQKWAIELRAANKELLYQTEEKEKKAAELIVANIELRLQNAEKEKIAAELIILNKTLLFQIEQKEKRERELTISKKKLSFQTKQKEKKEDENKELEEYSYALELSSQYSRSLIEASRDPLITINSEGKITDMNAATIQLTGVSRNKLRGSDFFHYFTDVEKAREAYLEVFAKGSVSDSPLTLLNKEGELIEVLFNGSVYKDNLYNVVGIVIVVRDVTDQKRIEQELTNAKILAELTAVIAEEAKRKAESATRTAEEAMKAKQQFLSNMSHEIRTPMNAIIGFTKVVLKTELSTKQREYLRAIKLSGDAMIVLINDILDLAKVDSGKLVFEQVPFRIESSIATMLQLFEFKIQEKNLSLSKDYDSKIPEVLLGDPMRLHQILLNLVSNAVKFTDKGEIGVSVSLESENEEKVTVLFAVKDTGIGIPQDKIKEIFENFQQASNGTSRKYGGTGLGLAIVKKLVEAQGGKVLVESEIEKGSLFSFTLDFLKTDENARFVEEVIEPEMDVKDIRVLVVEDIPLNQLLMTTLLDDFGFASDVAPNGKIAIEKLQKNEYDIILMDLQMPEMNGFEATDFIRKTLKLTIPIMALTADVTTVDLKKCKALGMNDYLAKPMDEKLLYSKILGLIKKAPKTTVKRKLSDHDTKTVKVTEMSYLNKLTKSSPKLMREMISLYLKQTPELVLEMRQSFDEENWESLQSAVHKMIPSFAMFGISKEAEKMARAIHDEAGKGNEKEELSVFVSKLETMSNEACIELKEEIKRLTDK